MRFGHRKHREAEEGTAATVAASLLELRVNYPRKETLQRTLYSFSFKLYFINYAATCAGLGGSWAKLDGHPKLADASAGTGH